MKNKSIRDSTRIWVPLNIKMRIRREFSASIWYFPLIVGYRNSFDDVYTAEIATCDLRNKYIVATKYTLL